MVIIRTSATEVSIQAVSPEFGVHFSSVLASQAGGRSRRPAPPRGGRLGRRLGMDRRRREERRRDQDGDDEPEDESCKPPTGRFTDHVGCSCP